MRLQIQTLLLVVALSKESKARNATVAVIGIFMESGIISRILICIGFGIAVCKNARDMHLPLHLWQGNIINK
jgi:hypothetical protein